MSYAGTASRMRVVSGSQSLQSAIDSANSGDKIFIHSSYDGQGDYIAPPAAPAEITVDKKLFIDGLGNDSVVPFKVNFIAGSSQSRCHHVKFAEDVEVSLGVVDMILTDAWIAKGKTITDDNIGNKNLYLLIEEDV